MSLEDSMNTLATALNANTAAVLGKKPPAGAAPDKPAANGKPPADKITMEMVKAAVIAVKDAHGKPAAMKIIREAGGVAELSAIKPARYNAVMAACAEVMGEGDTDEAAEDDEL